jgi:hypothetical protein
LQRIGIGARVRAGDTIAVDRAGLAAMLEALRARGFAPIGPTLHDGVVALAPIASLDDLPAGWHDEQQPGRYRAQRSEDGALFGYAVGPQSWKTWLHPPAIPLWRARRDGRGFQIVDDRSAPPRLAFVGVRPCELAAIRVQDRVFLEGPACDPRYRARRRNVFVLAAHCTRPAGCCFCASMGTGPRAQGGFDLALTELLDHRRHEFLVEVGSTAGAEIAAGVPARPASQGDLDAADAALAHAAQAMGRALDVHGLREALYAAAESPRWDELGRRCLGCANCTLACPTCFCTTVVDVSDLAGESSERVRRWDSCFSLDFSYVHGGSVRCSAGARYRQWITHKLASWHDQFGGSGCVGCGRCITWCPAGIDITAEAAALRAQGGTA